ncbi:MAG TPA: hypothetical protein VG407_03215 [Caulobacteraceae bacterium]|nr:hypothetical protein [Caulobacteraceae bacterium]
MDNLPPDWNDLEDNLDEFIRRVVGQRIREEVDALLKQHGLNSLDQELNDVRYAQQDLDKRVRSLAQELDQLGRDTHQNLMALSSHINAVAASQTAADGAPQQYVPPPPAPRTTSGYSYEEQPREGDAVWNARQAARMPPPDAKANQPSFFSQWLQQLTRRSAIEWSLVVVLVATLATMGFFGWKMFVARPSNTVAAADQGVDDGGAPVGATQSATDSGLAKLLGDGFNWRPCPAHGVCTFDTAWGKADQKDQDGLITRAEQAVIAQCKDLYGQPKTVPKGAPSWDHAAACGANAPKLDAAQQHGRKAADWLLQQLASQP